MTPQVPEAGPCVGTEPYEQGARYLSWTAAKRYEQCPQLQLLHSTKKVTKAANEKPFFVGRVVHGAFEHWLLDPERDRSNGMASYVPLSWAAEDEDRMVVEMRLIWLHGERDEAWSRAHTLCDQLEEDCVRIGLTQLKVFPEAEFRVTLVPGIGMWAKVDIWAEHPSENVGYLVEMKSGSFYDKAQVEWYAAVIRMLAVRQGLVPPRIFSVALRPAVSPSVAVAEIGTGDMAKQMGRAAEIVRAMAEGRWDPQAGWYCSTCEGRNHCPDWMSKYGGITHAGQVSI